MKTLNRAKELQDRTKFAVRVIQASTRVPKTEAGRVITRQFLRSGTSLAANYRAACRSRSAADFISKISIATEESDERLFWFELLIESGHYSSNAAAINGGMRGTLENSFEVVGNGEVKSLNR